MKNLICELDKWLSERLFGLFNCRVIFLIIEWSAHGIPWLIGFCVIQILIAFNIIILI